MADTIKISQLDAVEEVSASDLFVISAPTSSGYATNNISVSQLASAMLNDLEYTQELETTDKTIIGAINELNPQREWTLVGSVSGDSDDRGNIDDGVTVDLTGKTEFYINGYTTGTGSGVLSCNLGALCQGISANATRYFLMYFQENNAFFYPVFAKYGTSANGIKTDIDGYVRIGNKIEDVTLIQFVTPANVTSCELKIYAR